MKNEINEKEPLLVASVSDSAFVKRKKCHYCQKMKNKNDMYFLLKEKNKEYWICAECNYEHDVVQHYRLTADATRRMPPLNENNITKRLAYGLQHMLAGVVVN